MRAITAILVAGLLLTRASADEWFPPKVVTYCSADHHVRLTVTPRSLASALVYFDDKVRNPNDPNAGQKKAQGQTYARGVLERQEADGHWRVLWDIHLDNEVSPVSAVVANSGRYAVTFNNWHSNGYGDNAVVIYGPDGQLIRKLSLEDFLPDYFVKALPHSVSSIWWDGKHVLTEPDEKLVLKIVFPGQEFGSWDARMYADLPVDLATGAVEPSSGPARQAALTVARQHAAISARWEAEHDRWFRAPLLPPADNAEIPWQDYLVEAFFRTDPRWSEDFPFTIVLQDPRQKKYAESEDTLRYALTDGSEYRTVLMIASPASPENLVNVVTKILAKAKPGNLKHVRIYVAVPHDWYDRVAAALAPTGAKLIYLDPAKPIPQRQERLDGEAPHPDF